MNESVKPSTDTSSINQSQSVPVNYVGSYQLRFILAVVAAVFIIMFVYPPFQITYHNGVVANMGYGWIFDPPKNGYIVATVNVPMLLAQWTGILVIGGLAFLFTLNSQQKMKGFNANCGLESSVPSSNQHYNESHEIHPNNLKDTVLTPDLISRKVGENICKPYPWSYVLKRAGGGFVAGIVIGSPPPHLPEMADLIGYKFLSGILWGVVTGIVVGVYKFFKRD